LAYDRGVGVSTQPVPQHRDVVVVGREVVEVPARLERRVHDQQRDPSAQPCGHRQSHNTVSYNTSFTAQISEVDGPYGTKATFGYDGSGRLTTITNVGGLVDFFTYDSQNLITNLVTVYGTNSFKTTTNSFGGYNLGGINQVNRSVAVTEADGGKQLFLYWDSSSYLNPNSSVPLIPSSYSSGEVPVTSPLANTLDNTVMDARNSFRWNQKQFAGL
jgi:hypothetical protein